MRFNVHKNMSCYNMYDNVRIPRNLLKFIQVAPIFGVNVSPTLVFNHYTSRITLFFEEYCRDHCLDLFYLTFLLMTFNFINLIFYL